LYIGYARALAAKSYARRYSDEFEFSEYFQFAAIGLLEAVERFDPDHAVGFPTFATSRINGAILDGIERLSERQQQAFERQRILAGRAESISNSDDRSRNEIFKRLAEIAIGLAVGYLLEGSTMYVADDSPVYETGYTRIELRQLQDRVRALVESLPERERLIIKYHYLHHLRFETIAEMFSISKGRVSQLHKRALDLLRKAANEVASCNVAW